MLVMTDEKLAQFGILTRAAKGDELTFEEMDNNISTSLDVIAFDIVSYNNLNEYPAILSAGVAIEGTNTVTPVNGYCAIKIPSELDGMNIDFDSFGWIYTSDFSTCTEGKGSIRAVSGGVVVVESDDDVIFTIGQDQSIA